MAGVHAVFGIAFVALALWGCGGQSVVAPIADASADGAGASGGSESGSTSGSSGGASSSGGSACSASAGCLPGEVCCEGTRGGKGCYTTCTASYQLCNTSAECPGAQAVCVPLGGVFGSVCMGMLDATTGDAPDGTE